MASNEKLIKVILRLQDEVSSNADKAAGSLNKLSSTLTSVGAGMTAAITVPLVAAGAAGVKMALDLDAAMRNIQSISKQTDAEIAALSDTFIDMSTDLSKTTDSAKNLADAFYTIQGSGFAGADAMQILEASTKAATAGLTTTETAAKGVTAILNSYGMSAENASAVSDILFRTVDRGVGSFEELVGSISNVTGTAAKVGVSFEEIAAAMATMSKQGFSFSEASVSINQALTAFLSPSEAMIKAINEMGYASGSAMIDALGFAGSMQALAEHTGGSEEAMAALFGNVRSMRAAFALTGAGAKMFSEDLLAMADATGATAEAFAIQTKSFEAQWKNFQNTLNAMLIEIGQVLLPVLTGFMQNVLIPMIQAFRSLPEPVQQFLIGLLAIVAAIGPLLMILGGIAGAILQIQALFVAFPAVAATFSGAIALIFSPLGLLVAAIALAVAAILGNWFGLRDALVGSVSTIVDVVSQISDAFTGVGAMIAEGWQKMLAAAGTSFSMLGQIIMKSLSNLGSIAMDLGAAIIGGLLEGIKQKAVELIVFVLKLSKDITNAIKSALGISSPSKVMMKLGKQTAQGFQLGVAGAGGLETGSPSIGGRSMDSGIAARPAMAGAGGGIVQNYYIQAAPGTPDAQVRDIMRKIGKETKKKSGGLLGNR